MIKLYRYNTKAFNFLLYSYLFIDILLTISFILKIIDIMPFVFLVIFTILGLIEASESYYPVFYLNEKEIICKKHIYKWEDIKINIIVRYSYGRGYSKILVFCNKQNDKNEIYYKPKIDVFESRIRKERWVFLTKNNLETVLKFYKGKIDVYDGRIDNSYHCDIEKTHLSKNIKRIISEHNKKV